MENVKKKKRKRNGIWHIEKQGNYVTGVPEGDVKMNKKNKMFEKLTTKNCTRLKKGKKLD